MGWFWRVATTGYWGMYVRIREAQSKREKSGSPEQRCRFIVRLCLGTWWFMSFYLTWKGLPHEASGTPASALSVSLLSTGAPPLLIGPRRAPRHVTPLYFWQSGSLPHGHAANRTPLATSGDISLPCRSFARLTSHVIFSPHLGICGGQPTAYGAVRARNQRIIFCFTFNQI